MPLYALNEYADTMMAQRISMVPGVAQVQVFGAQKYAVRRAGESARRWQRAGIGIDEVENAVRSQNVNIPTGDALRSGQDAHGAGDRPTDDGATSYRPLIVAYRNGSPCGSEEVAKVLDSVEDDKAASWFNTRQAQRPRYRSGRAEAAGHQHHGGGGRRARNLLPSFRAQLPPSARLEILFDRSETIRESFQDIQFTMVLTLGWS